MGLENGLKIYNRVIKIANGGALIVAIIAFCGLVSRIERFIDSTELEIQRIGKKIQEYELPKVEVPKVETPKLPKIPKVN